MPEPWRASLPAGTVSDALVRRACIDIGSNTTRLLVADCTEGRLVPVLQVRAFTHITRGRLRDGRISQAKIDEVAEVVASQLQSARTIGARDVRVVATAAIRSAPNGCALADGVRGRCGVVVEILAWQEEARLAFVGVAQTLGRAPDGDLGVVDVGGGSSELVVGSAPDRVRWSASLPLGSGDLAQSCRFSDPPDERELEEARCRVASALDELDVPRPAQAAAVGGSAASLARLAGAVLEEAVFTRCLRVLTSQPAAQVARLYGLDVERVRLLPAGLLILQGAGARFGLPLEVGRGGLREGILLESVGG